MDMMRRQSYMWATMFGLVAGLTLGLVLKFAAGVGQHAGVPVAERHHLARQHARQAGEVETAGRLAEAERVAADARSAVARGFAKAPGSPGAPRPPRRPVPPAGPGRRGSGPSTGPAPRCRTRWSGRSRYRRDEAGVVLDHAVVDEPAAAGRVRMVVAVVLRARRASPSGSGRSPPRRRGIGPGRPGWPWRGPGRLKVWMAPSAPSHASPNAWWPRVCVSAAIRRRRARSGPLPFLVMNPKIPHMVVFPFLA